MENDHKEKGAVYYNKAYTSNKEYHLDPKDCYYYPLWKEVLKKINKNDRILEIGCGPGQFAKMCIDNGYNYHLGVDISSVAVNMANAKFPGKFKVANVYNGLPKINYDVIVMVEVMEHLKRDIPVIKMIKPGKKFIITLPTFNAIAHVRYFNNPKEIKSRYGKFLNYKLSTITLNHPVNNGQLFFILDGVK